MLTRYIQAAMKRSAYRLLPNRHVFGEIPGFPGLWSEERNVDRCRDVLQEVLEEWIILKLRDGDKLPRIDGISLNRRAA
jgi:hypothetical protein